MLRNQINARLKQIEIRIRQVDAAIAEKVALDKVLSNKLAILISIPGIAKTTVTFPRFCGHRITRLGVLPVRA